MMTITITTQGQRISDQTTTTIKLPDELARFLVALTVLLERAVREDK
jgi:hypothetical protein